MDLATQPDPRELQSLLDALAAEHLPYARARFSVDMDQQRPGHARVWLVRLDADPPGQGHGRRLIEAVCALADRLDIAIELNARPNENERLVSLVQWYAQAGFEPVAACENDVAMRRMPAHTDNKD